MEPISQRPEPHKVREEVPQQPTGKICGRSIKLSNMEKIKEYLWEFSEGVKRLVQRVTCCCPWIRKTPEIGELQTRKISIMTTSIGFFAEQLGLITPPQLFTPRLPIQFIEEKTPLEHALKTTDPKTRRQLATIVLANKDFKIEKSNKNKEQLAFLKAFEQTQIFLDTLSKINDPTVRERIKAEFESGSYRLKLSLPELTDLALKAKSENMSPYNLLVELEQRIPH